MEGIEKACVAFIPPRPINHVSLNGFGTCVATRQIENDNYIEKPSIPLNLGHLIISMSSLFPWVLDLVLFDNFQN